MSSRKKILICGGSGFIGFNMVRHFRRIPEFEVHATEHKTPPPEKYSDVRYHQVDLCHASAVTHLFNKKFDVVIQAAATTSGAADIVRSPAIHVTDNAIMNSFIFRAAADFSVNHVVFFSCTVMYPDTGKPCREEDFDPQKVFPKYFGVGWTKVYLEKMCEFFANNSSTRFSAIRHSNIYGPYDKFEPGKSHVFGATLHKVAKTQGHVHVWGDGSESRDFLHIDDLCRFVDRIVIQQTDPFDLVNVGSSTNCSVRDLVEKVIRVSKRDLRIAFDSSQPTLATSIRIDCTRAVTRYDWTPIISLDAGIESTWEWYTDRSRSRGIYELR